MPTKPGSSFTFATDANFGSGPASGFPTKIIPASLGQGFIPGNAVNAEWVNYLFNISGEWITDWILLGTFNPDEDAHIVESDASGFVRAAQFIGTGTAAGSVGVRGFGTGAFAGAQFDGGPTDGDGAVGLGGGANGIGLRGVGVGTGEGVRGQPLGSGPGVLGLGGPTGGQGVRGVAGTAVSNQGVLGETLPGADVSSAGVLGLSFGDAAALEANASADGYAGRFFANGARAHFAFNVRTTTPGTLADGDLWVQQLTAGTAADIRLMLHRDSTVKTVHDSDSGYFSANFDGQSGSNNNDAVFTDVATTGTIRPPSGGAAWLHLTMEIGNVAAATANDMDIEIEDNETGGIIFTDTILLDQTRAGYTRSYALQLEYALPNLNPRSFTVRLKKDNGATGTGVQWKNASLRVHTL